MNVYIKSGDITDMQGPCPSGFHIPTKDEFDGLISIMSGLSITTGILYCIYLHMPFVGNRSHVTTKVQNRGTYCYYFTSSYGGVSSQYRFSMYGSGTPETNFSSFTDAFPIRGFKDSYVTPDNTWTVIIGTLGSGGIFWNESDGIISITGDGSTGYTIADKNVGATKVYSDGDTYTDANMGYMYQRGNNYGFPATGTISNTSTSQVDASSYGPGNYYNSSTFIIRKDSPYGWDSSNNTNLRGGETGPVSMKEVQNIYIGEYGWKPGIYQKSDLGLISLSSDGKNWITIADKNIGASNVGDIGSFFQRGNNYQFPTSGFATSTSSINTSSYGPGNYYSSSPFRYGNMDWSNPSNLNLWGDTTDTSVARQGPCASGYHVASATEWNSLLTVLGTWSLASTGQYLYNYLKMPYAGYINNTNCAYQFNGQIGFYWSSSSNPNDGTKGGFLQFSASSMDNNLTSGWWKTLGCKVRPFKNEAVVPDSTWTVIYQPN